MTKLNLLGTTFLHSAMFTSALALAAPAMAQDAPAEPAAQPEAVEPGLVAAEAEQPVDCLANPEAPECGTIVVTGSRIRRPNLESPVPVTVVSGDEFFETGNVSVGDTLNDLPSLRGTFSQANSTRFLGTSGLNLLDLRGLGTVRTLVLQNGRRHVGGDVLSSGVTPDVNTMPTDLIERVEILTGGNSAVYGSDAIAGVVNFILKDDYEGIQLRGQGGVSKYGDAGAYFISGLWGTNFADDRGNIAVNFEYVRQQNAWGDDRKFLRDALTVVDNDTQGLNGPDRVLNPDFRSATFNTTGNIRFNTGQCGLDKFGNPFLCPYLWLPDGTLVAQTGERVGLSPNGQFIGGNGEGFFDKNQIQVYPQLDRYNVNVFGHFEISPAFVPFVEAKYSRTDSFGTGASGPAFIAGGVLGDPFQFFEYDRERISINNPFLTDQARDLICEQRALTITGALPCNANTRLVVQQSLLGLGSRNEKAKRETYRIVGGVKGDFNDDWNYEVSLNYGKLKERTKVLGNLDAQRFLLAMDAVDEGEFLTGTANGNIVCRSQIDPDAAFGYYPWFYNTFYGSDYPGADPNADARLANDVSQCVPINVLGGNFTQAQRDYVLLDTVSKGRTTQFDAVAFISGDTSGFLNLPGGPVGFVLGAEYRADDLFYDQDDDVSLGYTFYNAIPTFDAPKSKVKEAFGEIRIPIVKDVTMLNELEISGAARVSDYKLGNTGTVWAYNASAIWSPIEGLRFRGNYARSVRAPNQVELFSPFGQNFSLVNDPCDVNQIASQNNPNRAQNCLAAGIPAGTQITYSSSLPFLSGGNENLEAEKSDSITLGGVVTPSFLPGFSASVDYYNIKVKDAISFVGAQTVLNLCYDLSSLDNPYCALFQRADASGVGANNGVPYGIIPNSLHAAPVNFAKLKARGLDVEVAYRHQVGNVGLLNSSLTYTHVFELTNFADPTDPTFEDRVLSELGDPKDAFNWNTSLQRGRFTFGYQMRYVGKMVLNFAEDIFSVNGNPPQNEDYFVKKFYPARWYHDVRLGIDATKDYNFYVGIDNLTDTKPPFNASGIGGGSSIYDARGRFFYAGFKATF